MRLVASIYMCPNLASLLPTGSRLAAALSPQICPRPSTTAAMLPLQVPLYRRHYEALLQRLR